MAREVLEQLIDRDLEMPSHLSLQAGVGSMAASVLGYYWNSLREVSRRTITEGDTVPENYRAIVNGHPA